MAQQRLATNLCGQRCKPGKMFQVDESQLSKDDHELRMAQLRQERERLTELRKQCWGPSAMYGQIVTVYQDNDGDVWFQVDCDDGVIRKMVPLMVELC